MQRGFGYVMDDDYVNDKFFVPDGPGSRQRFTGSGNEDFYRSPPRTVVDCWARTTTKYQDGHEDWTNGSPPGAPERQFACG